MQYVFADEAGSLEFRSGQNISKYFILCTVAIDSCNCGAQLMDLRRQLAWDGLHADAEMFHATTDPESVRGPVYELIAGLQLRVDATVLEKSKALPRIRATEQNFYRYAWYYHFKHVAPRVIPRGHDVLISAASIGTKKARAMFRQVLNDVAQQVLPTSNWKTTFWPASTDPCLQIADYCAWAIQRKFEKGDARRYGQIQRHVHSCYDLFAKSSTHYY